MEDCKICKDTLAIFTCTTCEDHLLCKACLPIHVEKSLETNEHKFKPVNADSTFVVVKEWISESLQTTLTENEAEINEIEESMRKLSIRKENLTKIATSVAELATTCEERKAWEELKA